MIRKLTLVALCCLLLLGLAVAPAAAGNAAGVPVWAPAWLSGAKALSATITASPTHGVPGSEVIVTGSGFGTTKGNSYVFFGTYIGGFGTGSQATTSEWTDTMIRCTVPEMTPQSLTIRVTVQTSIIPSTYEYRETPFRVDAVPPPTISNVSPAQALPGATVVISGSGFRSPQGRAPSRSAPRRPRSQAGATPPSCALSPRLPRERPP